MFSQENDSLGKSCGMQCDSSASLVLLGQCLAVPTSHSHALILGIYQLMMICTLTKIWTVLSTDSLQSVEPKCPTLITLI